MRSAITLILSVFMTFSASASCEDIKERCIENFRLDMGACGDQMDEQGKSCRDRAVEQRDYCLQSADC